MAPGMKKPMRKRVIMMGVIVLKNDVRKPKMMMHAGGEEDQNYYLKNIQTVNLSNNY